MTQTATNTDRFAEWKARHPDKAAALQRAIAQRLGMRGGIKTDLGQATVDQWCESVLAALLGWQEEPE